MKTKSADRLDAMALRLQGDSYARISAVVGVSRQRVQQITGPSREVRSRLMDRVGRTCHRCGTDVRAPGAAQVHHREWDCTPDEYNGFANLEVLCARCHGIEHHPTQPPKQKPPKPQVIDRRRLPFDPDRLIQYPLPEATFTAELVRYQESRFLSDRQFVGELKVSLALWRKTRTGWIPLGFKLLFCGAEAVSRSVFMAAQSSVIKRERWTRNGKAALT